ncbi:hypothetical protein [Streptomyces avermitilis]|uniref:hypothetical protein n=1 Tax=Streptomyces avermitilis TaxID=33903 RepID=UPI00367A31AB
MRLMRLQRAVVGSAALVVLSLLAGCGSDDPMDDLGLPSAGDMASIAYYLNKHTSCLDLTAEADATDYLVEEAGDPAWGIKERASCEGEDGGNITLFTLEDMKKFQTAVKKDDDRPAFAVGRDFAVVPENDTTVQQLSSSEMMFLTCDPDFTVPSGYKKVSGLVDGCVLSDYFPTD